MTARRIVDPSLVPTVRLLVSLLGMPLVVHATLMQITQLYTKMNAIFVNYTHDKTMKFLVVARSENLMAHNLAKFGTRQLRKDICHIALYSKGSGTRNFCLSLSLLHTHTDRQTDTHMYM